MLDIISIILIFVLDNINMGLSRGFLILPYVLYLTYTQKKVNILIFIMIILMLSMHSDKLLNATLLIALNILFNYIYFNTYNYNHGYIVVISIVQLLTWSLYIGVFNVNMFVEIIPYLIFNLFYMRRAIK